MRGTGPAGELAGSFGGTISSRVSARIAQRIIAPTAHDVQLTDDDILDPGGRGYFESSEKLLEMNTLCDRFGVGKVCETGGYRGIPRVWGRLAG